MWRWPLAIGLALLLLSPAFAGNGSLAGVAVGTASTLVLVGAGLKLFESGWFRRDPYDLGKLREVHDRASWSETDVPEVDPDAEILCLNCGDPYEPRFLSCPRCGWRPGANL